MQATIIDALAIIGACLFVAMVAIAVIVFRPANRRARRRKRHSHRPKIDLFGDKAADSVPSGDA